MAKETKKHKLRPFVSPWTIPGWAIFLGTTALEALDFAHRFHFVAEFIGGPMEPLSLLRHWGWLVGAAWIVLVAWRAMNRPDAAEKERRMTYLRDEIVRCVRRFEAMVSTYEALLPAGTVSETLREARDAYFQAVVGVLREVAASAPRELRADYGEILTAAYLQCVASRETIPTTLFSKVSPPLRPIEQAIEILKQP